MKKLPFALVLLVALALSGCGDQKLTLKEIRNPTASVLGKTIVTQGYLHSSEEQDLLTGEKDRFVEMVDLALFAGAPKDQRYAKRMEIGHRLGGKLVEVHGRLTVGPFGLAGRSTVYVEVETIEEMPAAAEER